MTPSLKNLLSILGEVLVRPKDTCWSVTMVVKSIMFHPILDREALTAERGPDTFFQEIGGPPKAESQDALRTGKGTENAYCLVLVSQTSFAYLKIGAVAA
eukprot:6583215-Pyramimonas_sp.AAC.2